MTSNGGMADFKDPESMKIRLKSMTSEGDSLNLKNSTEI